VRRAALVLALAVVLCAVTVGARDAAAALYNQGNQAYAQGDFDKAIALYGKALEHGANNHRVHYNLANAYFQKREIGLAILHYERALRLAPGDADIRHNLRYARLATVDKWDEPETGFFVRGFRAVRDRVSLSFVVGAAAIAYLLFCTVLLVAVIGRRRAVPRTIALACAAVVFCAGLALAPLVWSKVAHFSGDAAGVVLAPKVEAMSGPGDRFTTVFTVHEGMAFRIQERREGWARVLIPSGFSGWIPVESFETI
jgi:hypothetical protein